MSEYIEEWQLESVVEIAATRTSTIHTAKSNGRVVVLKKFTTQGIDDEAMAGDLLEWYGGHGAVKLLQKDPHAHLLEYADGGELAELVTNRGDNEAGKIICDVVKQLHQPRNQPAPEQLRSLESWLKELFHAATHSNSVVTRLAAEIARHLLDTANNSIPLHGDLHHHNVMLSKRGWIAIDPKGLLGDPCYDLANFYCNPIGRHMLWQNPDRINRLTETFVRELGYPRERILQFAFVHCVLSTLWDEAVGGAGTVRLVVADIIHSDFL